MKRILVISPLVLKEEWRSLFAARPHVAVDHLTWEQVNTGNRDTSPPSLLIAALEHTGAGAADSLSRALGAVPGCPCLAVLPEDSPAESMQAVLQVAADFVLMPLRPSEFLLRVGRFLPEFRDPVAAAKQGLAETACLRNFVTQNTAFLRVLDDIRKLARANAPVLIAGETGTGKELCARALHHLSARRDGPFIPVDCPALPDHLFENELFGHVRGAFTDAHHDQKGLVALAGAGTLFLDEVDSLTPVAQGKLLRFLQDRTFRPLGSERFLNSQATVLAATNRNLRECVERGQFRRDLYFRLSVLQITLLPLRERPDDIDVLIKHYIREFTPPGAPKPVLGSDIGEILRRYDWPGNVRELINVVQRAVALAEGGPIQTEHLALGETPHPARHAAGPETTFREARAHALEQFERRYINELLEQHQGNVTRAARAAGKERRAFGRMMKKYGIGHAAGFLSSSGS